MNKCPICKTRELPEGRPCCQPCLPTLIETPQPIECRAAVEISPTATNEILFLPIGLHAITPVSGGIGRPIKVKVDQSSAVVIQKQYAALLASGKRAYFDFNHEDGPASFWPESFIWRQGEGVVAKGEWTSRGKISVEGKDFRAFSPVFHVDNKRSDPATVVCKETADPNMGGLVNNPAFKDLPLWAKNDESLVNAGVNGDNAEAEKTKMENEELAALRAKQQELQDEVDTLKASNKDANQSETALENIQLKIEAAELRSRSALLSDQIQAKNKVEADAAIKAAIERGAILPKDRVTQDSWRTQLIADPATFMPMIKALQGHKDHLSTRITSAGSVSITSEDSMAIFGSMARIVVNQRKGRTHKDKSESAKEFAAIYAAELQGWEIYGSNAHRHSQFPMAKLEDAIQSADVTDADLGTLSGTLVTQRTLELLKFTFPSLTMFTTDFSDEAARFNQTIMTRTVEVPNVVVYNTSTGWSDSDADTADVPVVIDHHEGVQIAFNENIMASTVRRLFDEFAPAAAYALAKRVMDTVYANITDANFPNNSVITTTAFNRASVVDIGVALDLQGVPSGIGMRTMILYPTVFGNLEKDTVLMQLAAFQKPTLITNPAPDGVALVIPVESFQTVKAPNLPTNNANLTGFAGSKSALCIATRVPNDYTSALPGASYGNVQVVTDPDIGLSVQLVQYVNHDLGKATSRLALMWGSAAGQSDAGRLIKAASGSGSSRTS